MYGYFEFTLVWTDMSAPYTLEELVTVTFGITSWIYVCNRRNHRDGVSRFGDTAISTSGLG